ncbi:MAG: hypothetical protein MZV65_37025 [Chromatiales bacterium]|nr:hypothetical protein [Chromatiales bacterium]
MLENSDKGPVLVNYWSPRAGPVPDADAAAVRLAGEFGGRFLLVMLNTDELGRLAREHGVVEPADGQGATATGRWWTRCTARNRKRCCAGCRHSWPTPPTAGCAARSPPSARGDTGNAVRLAAEAALADPHDPRIPLELAKLLVLQQRYRAQADGASIAGGGTRHTELRRRQRTSVPARRPRRTAARRTRTRGRRRPQRPRGPLPACGAAAGGQRLRGGDAAVAGNRRARHGRGARARPPRAAWSCSGCSVKTTSGWCATVRCCRRRCTEEPRPGRPLRRATRRACLWERPSRPRLVH